MTQRLKYLLIGSVLICNLLLATRYAGDFEEMGASARAFGLGGAYTASVADPSAIYYNPAMTTQIHLPQILFLHSENMSGIVKNNFLAYIQPQKDQSLGAAILTNRIPDIKITKLPHPDLPPSDTNQPYVDRIVNASDWIFYLNYARIIHSNLSLGGNFKAIYRSLGIGSGFGMGIDLAAAMFLPQDFKIGAKITNLTTSPLFWSNSSREQILPRIVIGLAKTFNLKTSSVLFASDFETNFDNFNLATNLGFEYLYKNTLGIRFGMYHWNPTFGVGFTIKRFFLDYAYLSRYNDEDLGASQKFSGGIRF
jgi:hypothetical protein